jgi:hypothetical protein
MSDRTAFEVGRLFPPMRQIADTLVASQKDIFVRLPALIGYWPMGIRAAGTVIEHGGTGFDLTQTGVCPVGYDGNSFAHLGDGTNFVWSSSSQLGSSGTQTWVSSSIRGMTVGGWFMFDSTPATNGGMITRDKIAPERGYALVYQSTGLVSFFASGNGASVISVASAAVSLSAWHFVVARFTPSAEIAVIADGDKSVNASSVPASLFFSAQDFEVGRQFNDNSQVLHGKVRDVFFCAAALSDDLIEEVRVTSVP